MTTLPYVYAALLDVLGYRNRLDRDRQNGSLHFKSVLENSLRCLANVNDAEFSHQAISDTIILTCSARDKFIEFLQVLRDVQVSFLKNGLFLRGGVTYQQHFRSGAIAYSHAYAGAHHLESTLAIYPRIVVDQNIVAMFESRGMSQQLGSSQLLCERNGVFFINIVTPDNWETLYDNAKKLYATDAKELRSREGAFSKHLWFQEYLFSSPHARKSAPRYVPSIRIWSPQDVSHDDGQEMR